MTYSQLLAHIQKQRNLVMSSPSEDVLFDILIELIQALIEKENKK